MELVDRLAKVHAAFMNNDYDLCLELWPRFEKECRIALETHIPEDLPHFDPFDGLDIDSEFSQRANLLLPPPPADEISGKRFLAEKHAHEASTLIYQLALDGSIKLNNESVNHLESCQTQISAAKEALQLVSFHLSQARLINQGESLTQIITLEED